MLTVWKFDLTLGPQHIQMPRGAKLLSAQTQGDKPCLWALVDDQALTEQRRVAVVGTGHAAPEDAQFVATFQMGWLVFHVFDGGGESRPSEGREP